MRLSVDQAGNVPTFVSYLLSAADVKETPANVTRLESAHNRMKLREAYAGARVEDAFSRFEMLERRVDLAEGLNASLDDFFCAVPRGDAIRVCDSLRAALLNFLGDGPSRISINVIHDDGSALLRHSQGIGSTKASARA